MSTVIVKYYQKCDFCNNDIELESGENRLRSISLPGFVHNKYSENSKTWIKADICKCCEEKLRNTLNSFLSIKENANGQIDIKWKNNN